MAPSKSGKRPAGKESSAARANAAATRFHHDEGGKLTLVTAVTVLGLVLLIGFIGNVGNVVKEKVELQNAADAAAYSSAAWMARGMNAVTATNHLLGEATALVTIHEALGGPQVDARMQPIYSTESNSWNTALEALANTAPIGTLSTGIYGERALTSIDGRLVNRVKDSLTEDNGKHSAGASIYDSRIDLKRTATICFTVKSIANLGFLVPPPWGYATAAAAYVAHLGSSATLVLIVFEWEVLDVLEKAASNPAMLQVKRTFENQLIPALSQHGDFIAGRSGSGRQGPGPVNNAIQRVLQELGDAHAADLAVYPRARDLRLPIEPEPKPKSGSTANPSGWGQDSSGSPAISGLGNLQNQVGSAENQMKQRINQLEADVKRLDKQEEDLDKRLEDPDLSAADKQKFERERDDVRQTRARTQAKLNKANSDYQKLQAEKQKVDQGLNSAKQAMNAVPGNPSLKHIPNQMNKQQESRTQWVRATYPYVETYRAPILGQFNTIFNVASMTKHYEKWSTRYAMVKSWQFRSGYRFRSGSWSRTARPLRTYVMRDTYPRGRTNDRKGREPWTGQSTSDKRKAEEYFTLVGFAHRAPVDSLFSPIVYKHPNRHGTLAYGQVVFYNANDQVPGGSSQTQANVGWDTLNWKPPGRAPEWGAPAAKSGRMWPWEIFTQPRQSAASEVHLNWQAKLMPVTKSRLRNVRRLPGSMDRALSPAKRHFDGLVTH